MALGVIAAVFFAVVIAMVVIVVVIRVIAVVIVADVAIAEISSKKGRALADQRPTHRRLGLSEIADKFPKRF